MRRDSLVFAVSGTFFGLLVGWILGSQSGQPTAPLAAPATSQAAAPQDGQPPPPPIDLQRVADLEARADANPEDPISRADLGNLYFDSERFDLAIPWYRAALAIDPDNVNVSTDLAVCYFYTGQTDTALAQIDRSLAIEPNHLKTLFNQGIILATGRMDLAAASESFSRVVALAPESPEAQSARELLDSIAQHATGAGSQGG